MTDKEGDMATAGETIENPMGGERFTFLRTAGDTGGEFLEMELAVRPGGEVPIPHLHALQEEAFVVLAGTLRCRVGDAAPRTLGPGEAVVVPAGVGHAWWNAGAGELRVRVTLRPALQVEAMFETNCGLARDGRVDAKGLPPFLQLVLLAYAYETYLERPPVPVQQVLFAILRPLARLRGYRARYQRYSGPAPGPGAARPANA